MGAHGSPSRGRTAEGRRLQLIPIAPVLAHYGVDLNEGRWGNEMAACPIHGERRPSMSVNAEKGLAHCFACGFGGDAIRLVMAMESCDRADAQRRTEEILKAAGLEVSRASRGRYQRPGEGRTPTPGRRYVPPGRRSA